MHDLKFMLKPKYETSRALIIGVNNYETISPLAYAVNDAFEVSELLINEMGFERENVIYITDQDATKSNILKSFLRFTDHDIQVDDRLFVFFAGHGHTRSGFRGDVGYLVPYDANLDDSSTFIRWDELTRNAELIRAKHILFVMDACYGGLAVHRDVRPGSSRFLRDMYLRLSRQVITAGKANEVVADAGGPLPNHSVFTGHLIEGIRGKAANEYGVITASGLMAYVYSKVANDINSNQTPHYGQFDGDGDFLLCVPEMSEEDEKMDTDQLMSIPYVDAVRTSKTSDEKIDYIKELISSHNSQIKLHDLVVEEIRNFFSVTSDDSFISNNALSNEAILEQIGSYESNSKDLCMIIACLCHWGEGSQLNAITKIISRSCDRLIEGHGGLTSILALRWYPLILMTYYAGIASLESKNFSALSSIFYTKLRASDLDESGSIFALKAGNATAGLIDTFKKIPEHVRHYTPISEYLYKHIQPVLDDLLFIGKGYENLFDEFEILFALVVADLHIEKGDFAWGPVGRFGWKSRNMGERPFKKFVADAEKHQDEWGPLKAGMFGGSYERFNKAAQSYQSTILTNLRWL